MDACLAGNNYNYTVALQQLPADRFTDQPVQGMRIAINNSSQRCCHAYRQALKTVTTGREPAFGGPPVGVQTDHLQTFDSPNVRRGEKATRIWLGQHHAEYEATTLSFAPQASPNISLWMCCAMCCVLTNDFVVHACIWPAYEICMLCRHA